MTVTNIDRSIATRITAAQTLREAVRRFNDQPISLSAVEQLVGRVLRVADFLAPPPHLTAVPDEERP